MKKLILTGLLMVLGGLTAVAAEGAGAPARTAEWQKSVETAVNDATKVAAIMQALPEERRGEFAADVLALVQAKRALMPNLDAWKKEFRAEALALLAGAGKGAQAAVMDAVAHALLAAYQPASGEWTAAEVDALQSMAGGILAALGADDRKLLLAAIRDTLGEEKKMPAALPVPMLKELERLNNRMPNRPVSRYPNQEPIEMRGSWFDTARGQDSWHGNLH